MITVDAGKDALVARAPFDLKDSLKAIIGARWDPIARGWCYPPTSESLTELAAIAECSVTPAAHSLVDQRHPPLDAPVWPADVRPMNNPTIEPWSHQRRAFDFAAQREGTALRLKMRMGKTLTSLALARAWGCELILVVSPPKVMDVWRDEASEHVPGMFQVEVLDHPSVTKRAKKLRLLLDVPRDAPLIVVTHYAAVWRDPLGPLIKSVKWDLVICDELHRLKSPGSTVSKFMARVKAKRRLGPTGTLLPNGIIDAYAQMRFVDPTIFGTSAAAFRARYRTLVEPINYEVSANGFLIVRAHYQRLSEIKALPGGRYMKEAGKWMVEDTPSAREQLDRLTAGGDAQTKDFTKRLGRVTISIDYDEADINLPEQQDQPIFVDLSRAARQAYEEMRKYLIAQVTSGEIVAANALVKSLRLAQIAGGVVETDEGEQVELCTAKIDALAEVVADWSGSPIATFCRFRCDLARIEALAEKLGMRYGEISGRRDDGKEGRFLARDLDLIAIQIQSGGLGLDFYACHMAPFFTLSWSASDYEQARYRFLGSRQKNVVTFPHIIARDTIDEVIWQALLEKISTSEAVMRHLKATK